MPKQMYRDPISAPPTGENEPFVETTFSELTEVPADPLRNEFNADGTGVEFGADGTITVVLDPNAANTRPGPRGVHGENLAEILDDAELTKIADKIIEWRDVDKESRKQWEARIGEALKLLGIEDLSKEDVNGVDGASRAGHPLLAEIAVQFQARAMEECFPSTGPCKTVVIGNETQERRDQADRVEAYTNYHLTERDDEYLEDSDQMLFLLPLHGSIFRKTYVDPIDEMPVARFCESTSIYVPYKAKSIKSATRITHQFTRSHNDVLRAVETGFYRDVDLEASADLPDPTREIADKADERSDTAITIDENDRTLLECHCAMRISVDDGLASYDLPYIITVDEDSRKILAIRRNWREGDRRFKKRNWFTHYKYLPGFGIYGFGLLHLVGVMAKVAGGAIRALLDAAARANFQGGFKSKEARMAGDTTLQMGQYKDVDMSAEELSNAFYTPDFKEPSQALMKLLEYIVDNARRFGSVTEAMVGDSAPTGPVGTMLAIIEQGSKVFSGIHRRIHISLRHELKQITELFGETLPALYPYEVAGAPREILRLDFGPEVDVIPVSDPNIFSSTQRISLTQATMELVNAMPDVFKGQQPKIEVAKRMLKALRVPNPDALLPKRPPRLDPVTENQLLLTARPVQAFAEQDHQAHIAVHMNFLQGMGEDQLKAVAPAVMAHVAEHQAHLYRLMALGQMGLGAVDLDDPKELPLEVESLVARAVAVNRIPAPQAQLPGQGQGGIPPEVQEQIKAQAEELQKKQEEVLKLVQQFETLKKQVEDAQRKLAGDKMKMDSEHERFLGTADLRKQELVTAERAAVTTIQQRQTQLERVVATIDAKMEKLKAMTEKLKEMQEAAEQAEADAAAEKEAEGERAETAAERATSQKQLAEQREQMAAMMKELQELGGKVVDVLAAPRQAKVTARDPRGRIQQVEQTVGGPKA